MNPLSDPSVLPDHVERLAASVVSLSTRRHVGSGVLLRPGVVVGSAAVLWRASSVAMILPGGETVQGEVAGIDGATDLAAVRFDSAALPVVELDIAAAAPRVGDFAFAVGRNPSGLVQASFGYVGMVAGEWRTWRGGRVDRLVRLDGGLYPGLEGAPVADAAGRVIGIGSGALSRHHGVVLPGATVNRVLDQLLAHGHVPHGWLGIAAQSVNITLGDAPVGGLLVSSVAADGPAARSGLRVADVIVAVGGQAVDSLEALRDALTVGASVPVVVARGGQRVELAVEVTQRPRSHCR